MVRRLLLLCSPLLVVLLTLVISQGLEQTTPLDWQQTDTALPAAQSRGNSHEIQILLTYPDGSPFADGQVVLLQPELQVALTDQDGVARFQVRGTPPYRVHASATNAHPALPPAFDSPQGGPFRLHPRESLVEGRLQPLRETDRNFQLRDSQDLPLVGAVVLARSSQDPGLAPFLGITDSQGQAHLVGVQSGFDQFEVFAPGLPPNPIWRLAQLTDEGTHQVPSMFCQVLGVKPNSVVHGSRLPGQQALRLGLADERGEAKLGPLPLGDYHFRNEEREVTLARQSGMVVVNLGYGSTKSVSSGNKPGE